MPATQKFVSAAVKFAGLQEVLQVFTPSGTRVNITTAAGISSAETALPAGAVVLRISATEPAFIRFGNTGMGAAAADTSSMYFPAGAEVIGVPLNQTTLVPFDFVRVIRAGANETVAQFESAQ